jgi:hypothetical protein
VSRNINYADLEAARTRRAESGQRTIVSSKVSLHSTASQSYHTSRRYLSANRAAHDNAVRPYFWLFNSIFTPFSAFSFSTAAVVKALLASVLHLRLK